MRSTRSEPLLLGCSTGRKYNNNFFLSGGSKSPFIRVYLRFVIHIKEGGN
jgi:hypothetical protein